LAKKRRRAGCASGGAGSAGARPSARSIPLRATSSTSVSWSSEPAAATTTLVGT
jgi:hypothetical protein